MQKVADKEIRDSIFFQYSKVYLLNTVIRDIITDLDYNEYKIKDRIKNCILKSDLLHNQIKPLVDATDPTASKHVFEDFEVMCDMIRKANFSNRIAELMAVINLLIREIYKLDKIRKQFMLKTGSELILNSYGSNRIMITERAREVESSITKLAMIIQEVEFKRFEIEYKKFVKE